MPVAELVPVHSAKDVRTVRRNEEDRERLMTERIDGERIAHPASVPENIPV